MSALALAAHGLSWPEGPSISAMEDMTNIAHENEDSFHTQDRNKELCSWGALSLSQVPTSHSCGLNLRPERRDHSFVPWLLVDSVLPLVTYQYDRLVVNVSPALSLCQYRGCGLVMCIGTGEPGLYKNKGERFA